MDTHENWKPVPGYEGRYEVSDQGRVRSLDRMGRAGMHASRIYRGKLLRQSSGDYGRRTVSLHSGTEAGRSRTVHALVLEAFVGPRPEGAEACHGDGDASNNHLDNLRWDTHEANEADKKSHGTHNNTVKTHCPHGHPLQLPNLVRSEWRKGFRACMACSRAHAWAHKRKIPFSQAIADDRYRRITS